MKLNEILDTIGYDSEFVQESLKPDYKEGGTIDIGGEKFSKYVEYPRGGSTAFKHLRSFLSNPTVHIEPAPVNIVEFFQSMLTIKKRGQLQPLTSNITNAMQKGSQYTKNILDSTGAPYTNAIRTGLIDGMKSVYMSKILNSDGALAFTDFDWDTLREHIRKAITNYNDPDVMKFFSMERGEDKLPMVSIIKNPLDKSNPDFGFEEVEISEFFAYVVTKHLKEKFSNVKRQSKDPEEYIAHAKKLANNIYSELETMKDEDPTHSRSTDDIVSADQDKYLSTAGKLPDSATSTDTRTIRGR